MQELCAPRPAFTTQRKAIVGILCGALIGVALTQPHHPKGEKLSGMLVIPDKDSYPVLGKCSGKEEQQLYQVFGISTPSPDTIDIWSRRYREEVSKIIGEYLEEEDKINCLEEAIDHLPGSAGGGVQSLAAKLPPWKEAEDLAMLARIDTGVVLLELLRTYECALVERYFFLFTDAASDLFTIGDPEIWWWEVFQEFGKQRRKIEKELAIARPTLNRTLSIANTSGGLRILRRNVECVKRSSIDIRNGFALGAEAAACMPRIQDAKGPFRDTP